MTEAYAESILANWRFIGCHNPDLWYEALAALLGERAPA